MPQWFAVEFLIDTGASVSSLHPLDAIRLARIPILTLLSPEQWPEQENHGGVGGRATYFPVSAHYAFMHHNGQITQREGEQIRIAQLTPTNTRLPSLLGWDILQHYRLTTDWSMGVVTLEDIQPNQG